MLYLTTKDKSLKYNLYGLVLLLIMNKKRGKLKKYYEKFTINITHI